MRVFGNCTCGVDTDIPSSEDNLIATIGGCGMSACQPYYMAFHGLIIIAAALIASTLVGKLIVGIRAVLPQDKALATASALMFIGLFVFIPGKIGYSILADMTCQYESSDGFRCFLHESPLFGDWINIITASLVAIGILFEIILLFFVGDLELYGDEDSSGAYQPIEMNTYRNGDSYNPPPEQQGTASDNTALLQNYLQSMQSPSPRLSPPDVTYAQIQRPANNDSLDFRLQSPRTDENSSIASDYRSTTSNGYVNFVPVNRQRQNPPHSPETSF